MNIGDLVRYDQDYDDIEGLFLVVEVSFYDKNYSNSVKLRCVTDGTEHWQPSRYLERVCKVDHILLVEDIKQKRT